MSGQIIGPIGVLPASGSGNTAQADAFIARAGLTGSDATNYAALINGLVNTASTISGSLFSRLDFLHIYAAPSSTAALMNLLSTSFTAVNNANGGSPCSFTAYQGFTGNFLAFLDTGYAPTSTVVGAGLNSACYGHYDRTSATADGNPMMGVGDGTNQSRLFINNGSSDIPRLNDNGGANLTSVGNYQGFWMVSRTGSAGSELYHATHAGGLVDRGSVANTSSGVPTLNMFTLTSNNGGGGATSTLFAHQVAADWAGAGFSSTDVTNFYALLDAYLVAVGGQV